MRRFALLLAMLFLLPAYGYASDQAKVGQELKQQLLGSPVFIQVFKEERILELYAKMGNAYHLVDSFQICKFSGGLGPKRREGDFMSPEGFYAIDTRNLNPNSHYYCAINIGFPNDYDRAQGYSGAKLMIHGDCRSIGCYAMTDSSIAEIYRYVEDALLNGQAQVKINIFPFRMTPANMQRHHYSANYKFWSQLAPGYAYFAEHHQPPAVSVANGQYVISAPLMLQSGAPVVSQFALAKPE
ncbi:peptidoglycan meso-diaminopimelic acid protein amidase [Candidatus Sodalis sp. SoCistrobi]|uniref:peptidoglycan meso-diaminopimelic acid protein amidase n=1 Tax=Candidatus Sodalis sp. SoCistrobi TaxID=1922216 RepID=UPI00093A615B|nr:peptidoglycan meso-diaminopimelic acid protein amidase [Candidatus Sodalis sp. SoCistrobi]